MESMLVNNINKLKYYCKLGLKKKLTIPVREISFPLTNVCNNYCIMCHACSSDYKNHTYFNEAPFFMTLEDYKKIVYAPKKKLLDVFKNDSVENECEIDFVFGTAETLLNPEILEIFKYTKEIYPKSRIRLISNGTIPPKGDIVKYIDRIGFSIDGCTKETFEKLRPPAKFEHVLDTIKKWDESAEKYNTNFSFGFGTVVSSENLGEISGIIRLASQFKHIDSVYLQPIILHESRKYLDYLLLNHVSKQKMNEIIEEIEETSKEVGVYVDGIDSIRPKLTVGNETKEADYSKANCCRYAWNGLLSFTQTGEFRYFCCYMNNDSMQELLKKYPIPKGKSLIDIYNCENYWKFRKDMLEGDLIEYCKGCPFVENGYRNLKSNDVDLNERIYV